jgi:hypothetical protein
MERAVISSIERMAFLEGRPTSNVQCVAPSDSAMACVGHRGTGAQTSYAATVDAGTGRYLITSNASKRVETGSESAHPAPTQSRPRATVFLNERNVTGTAARYTTRSDSITLRGSVVPSNAALTISGLAASPATAEYGYHPIRLAHGHFTLKLPVGEGANDYQISQGSEVISTLAVTRE